MASSKEIRGKISSVENTKKITKAMEMVAASKMRKAQERMRAARPYSQKVRQIAANLSRANPDYSHAFMRANPEADTVGFILVTTDKGLCGGMNTNILRSVTAKIKGLQAQGKKVKVVAIGSKGLGFMNRTDATVVSQASGLGDTPHLDSLIGPSKVLFDAYAAGELSEVHLCFTRFVNTMRQEATIEQLLPINADELEASAPQHSWDYMYEPEPAAVIDDLLLRYVEAQVFQGVAENMASEQSARMVAMKAATDNAGTVISDLKLVYNKTRQAAITKELSEIVAGAAAV